MAYMPVTNYITSINQMNSIRNKSLGFLTSMAYNTLTIPRKPTINCHSPYKAMINVLEQFDGIDAILMLIIIISLWLTRNYLDRSYNLERVLYG